MKELRRLQVNAAAFIFSPKAGFRFLFGEKDDFRILKRLLEDKVVSAPLMEDLKALGIGVSLDIAKEAYEITTNYLSLLLHREAKNISISGPSAALCYALVRMVHPRIVVETGVADGFSSAIICNALAKNGFGELYSIDVHDTLGDGFRVGWLVPNHLTHLWHFIKGESKTVLPRLLSELKQIDIFIHDSDHSYENMMFEFETAYQYTTSFIISDDVNANTAWRDFTAKYSLGQRVGDRFALARIKQK